jgi:hypothetical protein
MGDFSLDLRAVLTIVSILTAITIAVIFQWWRNRKILAYKIVSSAALFETDDDIKEKLEIIYDGQSIENAWLFVVRISNKGQQPIDDKDYKGNIKFQFADDAEVLSATLIASYPDDLELEMIDKAKKNELLIKPFLMNKQDYAEIKILVCSESDEVECLARAVGIKSIKREREEQEFEDRYAFRIFLTIMLLVSASLVLINIASYFKVKSIP